MLALLLALAPAALQYFDDQGNYLLPTGNWRAWLDCPGGDLPFNLLIEGTSGAYEVFLLNGSEKISVSEFTATVEKGVRFGFPHYDSEILAQPSSTGGQLDGTWRKRRGPNTWVEMPFHAMAGQAGRFPPGGEGFELDPAAWTGRWSVQFAGSPDPAVGLFFVRADELAQGTFLTTTGDYRFLAGRVAMNRLWLSTFDGAHAFLFRADLQEDGSLRGDFWSDAAYHETWTAHLDPDAALPDPFAEAAPAADAPALSTLKFKDLAGVERALDDPAFAGKARVISLFGSWCPNCNDEARLWAELHARYAERGLSIVSLAFELTGEPERDLVQVRRFKERHDVRWPLLLGGVADKEAAARALPLLTRVKAFPTAIFLDAAGKVRAVHSGFAGPAAGAEHERQRMHYERIIEELLAESAANR